LLPEVDFLSIGTNDLTQYVLGLSRHAATVSAVGGATAKRAPTIADARHPDVVAAIERVIQAAKRHSKPVSVCGESAADPETAKLLIKMGVDSLSASPALLPQLRLTLLADSFGV
jgi:phosphotransferase system enzyme I (PtsP)